MSDIPHPSPPRHSVQLDEDHYRQRITQIRHYLDEQQVDGLLFLSAANVMWACGLFHIPNERPLGLYVPLVGEPVLFVPLLEKENAQQSWIADVRWYLEYPGEVQPEVWMLQQIVHQRVVIDGIAHGLFGACQEVKSSLRIDAGVARLRYLKSLPEIALTELAASYADFGLDVARQAVADGIAEGITELDLVQRVQVQTTAKMRRELDELINFYRGAVALTAHTGPRAALPHGQPGPVAIRPGDTLIVGIGVKVGGYHAESGCTFVVGDPTPDQLRCLETTWSCNQAALEALRPGTACSVVNDAAWTVLRNSGYGDYIRHRIGHGMGLEGHEPPWLSVGDETRVQPSMVFSNEPGIYRPGVDGYRIIDTMVVTEQGGRRLSRYLSEHGPDDRVIPV